MIHIVVSPDCCLVVVEDKKLEEAAIAGEEATDGSIGDGELVC